MHHTRLAASAIKIKAQLSEILICALPINTFCLGKIAAGQLYVQKLPTGALHALEPHPTQVSMQCGVTCSYPVAFVQHGGQMSFTFLLALLAGSKS